MSSDITKDKYEFLTIYKGKDEATYLLKDLEKNGKNTTPIQQRLHPTTKNAPFVEFNLEDIDGFALTREYL